MTLKDKDIVFTLWLDGIPAPWQAQMRNAARTPGFLRMQAYQQQLQVAARHHWGHTSPLSELLVMDIEFWLEYPQSAPQRQVKAMENWVWKHRGMKPDRDNLQKACSDALQGIVYDNDSQIVDGRTMKDFATPVILRTQRFHHLIPCTRITIWEGGIHNRGV